MKEIGVGIIGFGFMGKAHTYGYKTIPLYYGNLPFKIKLVGVCTAHMETANAAKESNGFEFATINPYEIFNRDDIQVVNICTPNMYHKEAILQALSSGKNIYCEKPLSLNYNEAIEILSELENRDAITQVTFHNRFFPATMRAKQLIEEGKIGRILSFRASYLHSGSVGPRKPIGWKQDKNIGGGGVLIDIGSHVLDMIYFLAGEYQSICAKTEILYRQRPDKAGNMVNIDAEDMVMMLVKMKNGATGTIEASKTATGIDDELRFEIHGDKGAIRFNLMEPNWLDYYDNTAPERPLGGIKGFTRIACVQRYEKPGGEFPSFKSSIGWLRGHVHSLYSFLTCVYEGKQASPSFKEGAYIQYVMEKAYESDKLSQWVNL